MTHHSRGSDSTGRKTMRSRLTGRIHHVVGNIKEMTWRQPKHCVFCTGLKPEQIISETDDLYLLEDKYPRSKFHYLVITKEHINSVLELDSGHIRLLQDMVLLGKQCLTDRGAPADDHRLGFHIPPFNSIDHLHMHAIAGPFRAFQEVRYTPRTPTVFADVERVLKILHEYRHEEQSASNGPDLPAESDRAQSLEDNPLTSKV
eukprot:Clim_evm74s225 gene=Clim_evmTU74s225